MQFGFYDLNRRAGILEVMTLCCLLIACLSGCYGTRSISPGEERSGTILLRSSEYPYFHDDMGWDGLEEALNQSTAYFQRLPGDTKFHLGNEVYTRADLIRSLEVFRTFIRSNPSTTELNQFIKRRYRVYKSIGGPQTGQVLFTGYFEPVLEGSLMPGPDYPYPVYGLPDDLVHVDLSSFADRYRGKRLTGRLDGRTVVPYYDRREILEQKNALPGMRPIAWVRDRIGLFFLEIQGSGKIRLTDGALMNLHYGATNGHPYRSIGALLIREGKIPKEEMSMQKIRQYLNDHPHEVDDILNHNPSRVFFKTGTGGPFGSIGVALTPGRSLATDRHLFVKGALTFVKTTKPLLDATGHIRSWSKMNRFLLNQDTGGAIRGPGRGDIFWGYGPYAEVAAGHMKHFGQLYVLVLHPNDSQ